MSFCRPNNNNLTFFLSLKRREHRTTATVCDNLSHNEHEESHIRPYKGIQRATRLSTLQPFYENSVPKKGGRIEDEKEERGGEGMGAIERSAP